MKNPKKLILILIVGGILLGGTVMSTIYLSSPSNDIQVASTQGGLVAHWSFDGDAKDRTPYSHHATVSGASLTTDRKGQSEKAYDFNGTANLIYFADSNDFSFTAGNPFSVSVWVNPDVSPDDYDGVIGKWDNQGDATKEWLFRFGAGDTFEFRLIDSDTNGSRGSSTSDTIPTGQWTHIVGTTDGATNPITKIYINGIRKDAAAIAAGNYDGMNNTVSKLYIGAIENTVSGNGNFFDGKLDDVRIYNKELTASEVTQLYNSYNGGIQVSSLQKGLVAYWDFNGDVKDRTPYSNHGTIVGSVTTSADQKGQADKARYFNGGSYIDVGNDPSLSLTGAQTWAFWTKNLDKWPNNRHLISKGECCWSGYLVQISAEGVMGGVYVVLAGVYADWLGPAGTATYNVWEHFVISYTGSTLTLYKNGAYVNHANVSGTVTQYSGTFKIGRYSAAAANYYLGHIGELRIYNRGLSAAEAKLLYDSYR